MKIPLIDVKAQYAPLDSASSRRRSRDVLENGQFVFGPNVEAFEREAADYLGVPETVGVANGTDAIVLVPRRDGDRRAADEVICPPFTFYATAESIARVGATPVFADIDPVDAEPRPGRRRAPAHGEDEGDHARPPVRAARAARGAGRPSASRSSRTPRRRSARRRSRAPAIASTFSFYPTKNLFGLGDGGLVAVRDEALAERLRMLRFHGSKAKKTFEYIGYNSRLDEVQAAALRIFLRELDGWTSARREAAARYAELGLGDSSSCRPTSRATSTTSSSAARPSATASAPP